MLGIIVLYSIPLLLSIAVFHLVRVRDDRDNLIMVHCSTAFSRIKILVNVFKDQI
mgnify:CR=1 FL=1